jgi:hypothetical protein
VYEMTAVRDLRILGQIAASRRAVSRHPACCEMVSAETTSWSAIHAVIAESIAAACPAHSVSLVTATATWRSRRCQDQAGT